jgi:predicted membrane channel-forming protein YqfA (hemolysin III family)
VPGTLFPVATIGDFHSIWGWVAVALTGGSGVFGLVLHFRHRPPAASFRIAIAVATGAVVLQVLLGIGAMNLEGTNPGNQHVFYGIVISFTLGFAYIYRPQLARKPALYYGLLMLFTMGLGIRGILTFGHSF